MFKSYPLLVIVVMCAACGSRFSAGDDTGGLGSGGTGQAGEASGGGGDAAGTSSGGDAGAADVAGSSSGGMSSGGSSAGSGGAIAGSAGSAVGGSSGVDCTKLKQDYQVAVEKARVCDRGSTNQCNASSTLQPIDCGCPVLVNAKSEYAVVAKKAYQTYQDSKCAAGGVACANVACLPIAGVSCAQQMLATGNDAFVCTSSTTF